MKKQGEAYLKLISILLAGVIAAYVLFSVVLSTGSSYALETAVYCEVGDGVTVSGFVVRSEEVLVSAAPTVVYALAEGERVGSGQVVATGCGSDEVRQKRQEIAALTRQKEQLQAAAAGANRPTGEEIAAHIVELSAHTARQELTDARAAADELIPTLLRRGIQPEDMPKLQSRIAELDIRIAALEAETAAETTAITVSRAGYFSCMADGCERILTPAALETLTLAELRALSDGSRAPATPENAIGRLIVGQKWFLVTEIPTERAESCTVGDRLQVNFAEEALRGLTMRVEHIGEPQDGMCILTLSCEKNLHKATNLRRISADIIFETYEGLRVPKRAIYHIDGETGVYVLENRRAMWKEIELLTESGDDYIVRWDPGDTDNLWPKDALILTAEEIEDGMVIS